MWIDLGDKTGNIEKTRVCNVYKFKKYYALLALNVKNEKYLPIILVQIVLFPSHGLISCPVLQNVFHHDG